MFLFTYLYNLLFGLNHQDTPQTLPITPSSTPTNPNQQDQTPNLLTLPPETRLQIYPTLFPVHQTLYITPCTPSKPLSTPPILLTSPLLRTEALRIFYSTIELRISILFLHNLAEISQNLSKIPPTQIVQIRSFSFPWLMRFEVIVQLTKNPVRKMKRVERDDRDAVVGVVMAEKYYVRVMSVRKGISREFCEKFAQEMSKFVGSLLADQEANGEEPHFTAGDLVSLIEHIDNVAPSLLMDVCGVKIM